MLQANSLSHHKYDYNWHVDPKPKLFADMARLYPKHQAKEIARAYGVSLRTVRRAITKHKRYRFPQNVADSARS